MARNLTSTEKKEIRNWANENNINLSYNKKLEFGNGFWLTSDIFDLKTSILQLESSQNFKLKARNAVGNNNLSFDADCVILGENKGKIIISFNNKEIEVKLSTLSYVNGFLAVPKNLFN